MSNVFPYKSRESNHLLVSMVKEDLPKDQLLAKVDLELRNTYKIDSDPVASKVMSWKNALPVYNKNLKTLQNKVRPLHTEGIYFHANWIDGISIKECISKSKKISTFL